MAAEAEAKAETDGEGGEDGWALDDATCTRALMELSRAIYPIVGDRPGRDELEQWMCFIAAVWNAVVVLQVRQDFEQVGELIAKVEALQEPARSEHSAVLLEVADRKLRHFGKAGWVYRHVHVLTGDDELRIRAEALTWGAWEELGVPLRMGLPE